MFRVIVPGLAGLALLVVSLGVSSAGDLKAIAARKQAAVQKLQWQVKDAIERSLKMDTRDASFLLENIRREVENSADLLESERAPLLSQLAIRMRAVNQGAQAKKANDKLPPPRDPPIITRPVAGDPPSKSTSNVAKDFMTQPKAAAELHAKLIRDREKGNLDIIVVSEKFSPIPGESGIAFPAYWGELTKSRLRLVSKLTPREVKVLKTLNTPMSVNYNNDNFKAVLKDLEEKTGLSLFMDPNSERDIDLNYDDPITFKAEKQTVRTILKVVLGQERLTYIIKEGNIQVMTPKRASETTTVRVYMVDDLLGIPNAQLQLFNPQMAQLQKMQNAQRIIQLIMMTTDPNYWQANGGPGSIVYYEGMLIIRASSEMHYQVASPGLFAR